MSKRITINPITRLEGHGKIEIFLSDFLQHLGRHELSIRPQAGYIDLHLL